MELIDREAFKKRLISKYRCVPAVGIPYGENWETLDEILADEPIVDPIHVAGGCYCWECKYSSYDEEYNKRWCNYTVGCKEVKLDGNGFCSYGKPRGGKECETN